MKAASAFNGNTAAVSMSMNVIWFHKKEYSAVV